MAMVLTAIISMPGCCCSSAFQRCYNYVLLGLFDGLNNNGIGPTEHGKYVPTTHVSAIAALTPVYLRKYTLLIINIVN